MHRRSSHRPADVRPAVVAGRFYPSNAIELEAEVTLRLGDTSSARPRIALMAPHAGYVYSGGVAGCVFAAATVPRHVIVLAPNHTGRGARLSVWRSGAFELPNGEVPVDEILAGALCSFGGFVADRVAHEGEHALEVELPFLLARNPEVCITPIVLGALDVDACAAAADALLRATEGLAVDDVLMVASSDMNHYLDDATTRRLDERALEPLLELDARALHQRVLAEGHSMCGVVPATVMLMWARARGATTATLHSYATSGDAFGERERVVGYAGVTVE